MIHPLTQLANISFLMLSGIYNVILIILVLMHTEIGIIQNLVF